jgi:hypothetical protein
MRSDAMATDEVRKGEIGCLFDEIQNLVEPIERSARGERHCGERPDREIWAGPLAKQGMRSDAG